VTRYRAVRETLPRVPTAFQGSKCVRGGLKRREYQVRARYQIRSNALLEHEWAADQRGGGTPTYPAKTFGALMRAITAPPPGLLGSPLNELPRAHTYTHHLL